MKLKFHLSAPILRVLAQAGCHWRHDERGVTAVEFAIVGPIFLLFLFAIIGVGLDEFYQLTFDDAVRVAARQIQIDAPAATTSSAFVAAICSEFSTLASDCATKVSYNVQASSQSSGFSVLTPVMLPTSGTSAGKLPNNFFSNGQAYGANVNVMVQAAYPLPFAIPFVSTWITLNGTTSILSTTSVRAEPLS